MKGGCYLPKGDVCITFLTSLTFFPLYGPTFITPSVKPLRYTSCLASASFLPDSSVNSCLCSSWICLSSSDFLSHGVRNWVSAVRVAPGSEALGCLGPHTVARGLPGHARRRKPVAEKAPGRLPTATSARTSRGPGGGPSPREPRPARKLERVEDDSSIFIDPRLPGSLRISKRLWRAPRGEAEAGPRGAVPDGQGDRRFANRADTAT